MMIPITLYIYIGRQFLVWFGSVLGLLSLLIFAANFIELTRRAVGRPEIGVGMLSELAGLQSPQTALEALPFAVLLGALLALWRMTRTQELVVARAAGISVWQFLTPAIVMAFAIGAVSVTVCNPIASAAQAKFKRLDNQLLKGANDPFMLSSGSVWLRQAGEDGQQIVLHAAHLSRPDMVLDGVTLFFFARGDVLIRRIDAAAARLEAGDWRIENGSEWVAGGPPNQRFDERTVASNLTPEKVEESFAAPETMPFWALPGFIELLERSGFSAQRHLLFFDSLLARPFLLCAMVLIAATFSLRLQRRGGAVLLAVAGVASGFLVWFLSDVVNALGSSSIIPAALAAWAPAVISGLLGTTFLLYLEDG